MQIDALERAGCSRIFHDGVKAERKALGETLREKGVGFRSLTDPGNDTTNASGALIFYIFGALAAFERELIRERTRAGPPRCNKNA